MRRSKKVVPMKLSISKFELNRRKEVKAILKLIDIDREGKMLGVHDDFSEIEYPKTKK